MSAAKSRPGPGLASRRRLPRSLQGLGPDGGQLRLRAAPGSRWTSASSTSADNALSFNTRFRSRRDVRAALPQPARRPSTSATTSTRCRLRYEPPKDDVAFEVGRLGSSRFTSIGYLDGALRPRAAGLARCRSAASSAGAPTWTASGSKARARSTAGSSASRRETPIRPPTTSSWSSVVREFAQTDVSREYLGVESRFGSGKVSVFGRSEVDLNRGWRRTLAEPGLPALEPLRRHEPALLAVGHRGRLLRQPPELPRLLHAQRAREDLRRPPAPGLSRQPLLRPRLRPQRERRASGCASRSRARRPTPTRTTAASATATSSRRTSPSAPTSTASRTALTDGYLVTAQAGKRFRQGHQLDLCYGRSLYRVKATEQQRETEYLRFSGRGRPRAPRLPARRRRVRPRRRPAGAPGLLRGRLPVLMSVNAAFWGFAFLRRGDRVRCPTSSPSGGGT